MKVIDFYMPESSEDFGNVQASFCRNVYSPDEAVVMDPEKPGPVTIVAVEWAHTELDGPFTAEVFREYVRGAVAALADEIKAKYLPYKPVRIYKDVLPAYATAAFDFRDPAHPYDLRAVMRFEQSIQIPTKDGDKWAPGFKFWLSTLVLPDAERDKSVPVGIDWGKAFDAGT